jgi:hypothetical protein
MLLTRLAHEPSGPRTLLPHAVLMALVLLARPALAAEGEPPVIDLTKPAANQTELLAAPGFSSSTAAYRLPLNITIRQVKSTGSADNFRVELLVQNIGASDFDLPVSRDSKGTLHAGNKGRSTFLFKLQTSGSKPGQLKSTTMISLSGSVSVPDSMFRIRPGEVVAVLLDVDMKFLPEWKTQGAAEVEIEAICSQWRLDDSRFYIDAASQDVKSVNSEKIPL